MPNRCPESDTATVSGEEILLQCAEWSDDPEGRHRLDHYVDLSPADGGRHTWPNQNPRPDTA